MRNLRLGLGFQKISSASVYVAPTTYDMYSGYASWWKHNEGSGLGIIDYGTDTTNASFQGMAENLWAFNGPDGNPVGCYLGAPNAFSNDIGATVHIAGSANTPSMTWLFAFYHKDPNQDPADTIISKQDRGNDSNWKFEIISNKLWYDSHFGDVRSCSNLNLAASTWYIAAMTLVCDAVGQTTQWYFWNSTTSAISAASGGLYGHDPDGEDDYIIIGGYDGAGDESSAEQVWEGLLGDIVIWDTMVASSDIEDSMKSIKDRYNL